MIILRLALIRTQRAGGTPPQHTSIDAGAGQIIATRQAGLVQVGGAIGIGDDAAGDADDDVARRLQHVDPLEGVFGVHENRGRFLEPLVRFGEVEAD
jgi:hypothetical protein